MTDYYDNFVYSNASLQSKLGVTNNAINKNSAVYSTQVRSLLQLLNYGLDGVTSQAVSQLLNLDVLNSNSSYLLKLCEGLLLNSVKSITPPMIAPMKDASGDDVLFKFYSTKSYDKFSSLGTIRLNSGRSVNLTIIGDIKSEPGRSDGESLYSCRYCAGQVASQSISIDSIDIAVGTMQSILIPETYKSVWTDSLTIRIKLSGSSDEFIDLTPIWSMTELLNSPNRDTLIFAQHTVRGISLILGDGELYGAAYSNENRNRVSSIEVEYIKMDYLDNVDNSSIKFNKDVEPYRDIPVLTKLIPGDTMESLRTRSINDLFANGKITDEIDLVTELSKIPIVRSCSATRKHNEKFYFDANKIVNSGSTQGVPSGSFVKINNVVYFVKSPITIPTTYRTSDSLIKVAEGDAVKSFENQFLSIRHDNATIHLSGLMVKNRQYYIDSRIYQAGDVVYDKDSGQLYRCASTLPYAGISPTTETDEVYWISESMINEMKDPNSPSYNLNRYRELVINDYEQITQSSYELELKSYFNIANKLGFTSVIVDKLATAEVVVDCEYESINDISMDISDYISDYVLYNVGKNLSASELNSILTDEFNLTKVYCKIGGEVEFKLNYNQYVPRESLVINCKRYNGGK